MKCPLFNPEKSENRNPKAIKYPLFNPENSENRNPKAMDLIIFPYYAQKLSMKNMENPYLALSENVAYPETQWFS